MTRMRRALNVPVPELTRYLAVKVFVPGVSPVCRATADAVTLTPADPNTPTPRLSAGASLVAPEISYDMRADPAPEFSMEQWTMTSANAPVCTLPVGPVVARRSEE